MTNNRTQVIAHLAIFNRLDSCAGLLYQVANSNRMVTLLDLGVYFTAFYLGRKEGAVVGGLGAFLLDLLSGYPQWMFFSLLFHGAQGYFAGFKGKARYIGLLLGTVIMVGGYALASALFLGNTWVAAIEEVPHNLVQTSLGWLWDMLCIILTKEGKLEDGVRAIKKRNPGDFAGSFIQGQSASGTNPRISLSTSEVAGASIGKNSSLENWGSHCENHPRYPNSQRDLLSCPRM